MRSQPQRQNGTTRSLATLIANRYWRADDAERVLEAWRRSGPIWLGGVGVRRRGIPPPPIQEADQPSHALPRARNPIDLRETVD